jgi:peroxiredoxin
MKILPHTFKYRVAGEWQDVSTLELFNSKRVVIFGLPGAFTPTCSSKQLPGYEERYGELIELGVDEVYCVSVNDAFVMNAWADAQGIEKVKMIPDGDGTFTRSLGMLVNKPKQGFGLRSWRYSAVLNAGLVEKWFEEPGLNNHSNDQDPYIESTPEKMIKYLQETHVG